MAEIAAELVAVERVLWSGKASIVTAQTIEGEIGVLPGHEPMLGQLVDNGVVTITPVDGDKLIAACHGPGEGHYPRGLCRVGHGGRC